MAEEKKDAPAREKGRGVFNASKVSRKYEVRGWDDKDGNRTVLFLTPGKSTLVPEPVAEYLLSKMAGGRQKFPDLLDSDQVNPEAAAAEKAAIEENKRLAAENEALKAQLAELSKDDGKKGDKKDDGKKGGK